MDRTGQRGVQHIGLATACAVIYSKITGEIPDPREGAQMQAVLNDVAHALSNLVTIYAADSDSEVPKPIAPLDLIEGQFLRGGQVFKSKRGSALRALTIQRREMMTALSILKSAGITFRRQNDRRSKQRI